jgi:hypothetical protein
MPLATLDIQIRGRYKEIYADMERGGRFGRAPGNTPWELWLIKNSTDSNAQ